MSEVVATLQLCKQCGKEFVRTIHLRKYCSTECATEYQAEANRQTTKRAYWADPEARRAAMNRWYREHRESAMESNRRSQMRTCTKCGAVKRNGDIPKLLADTFVCGACKKAERRLRKPCYFCGEEIERLHSTVRPKATCADCYGILSRYGEKWCITRERVRQILNDRVSTYAVRGKHISRRAVLEEIDQERSR